jgi:hypothetical protein
MATGNLIAYICAGLVFAIGFYLIITGWRDRDRMDLTERIWPHRPIADQARQWLDQHEAP